MKVIAALGVALVVTAGCKSNDCCSVDSAETAAGLPEMTQPELEATIEALSMALEDERKSEAMYMAVMRVHGERRPFSNIIKSERMHQSALVTQFERLGVEPPAAHEFKFEIPQTFEDACQMAIDAELANADLYDTIESKVTDPTILGTFSKLRWASENCHLPAFERAKGGDTEADCGSSCADGNGKNKVKGKGCGGQGGGCGGGGSC